MVDEKAGKETKEQKEKPKAPELVELKDIAKQAGLEPRAARVLLRGMGIRGDDKKRARWAFPPGEVAGVAAKLKAAQAKKVEAAVEKKATEAKE